LPRINRAASNGSEASLRTESVNRFSILLVCGINSCRAGAKLRGSLSVWVMSVKKRGIASPLDLQATMNYGLWSAFDVFRHGLGKIFSLCVAL
jgi:hypothetical protein